jgi:hypothetical protein
MQRVRPGLRSKPVRCAGRRIEGASSTGAPIYLLQQTPDNASVATTGRYLHARPTDSSARYLGV